MRHGTRLQLCTWLIALIVPIACFGLSARPALAQPVWLRWQAPASCPDASSVNARIASMLERSSVSALDVEATAHVKLVDRRYVLQLSLRMRDGRRVERRLVDASCASLSETAAWLTALAIDPHWPEAAREATHDARTKAGSVAKPASPSPSTETAGSAASASAASGSSGSQTQSSAGAPPAVVAAPVVAEPAASAASSGASDVPSQPTPSSSEAPAADKPVQDTTHNASAPKPEDLNAAHPGDRTSQPTTADAQTNVGSDTAHEAEISAASSPDERRSSTSVWRVQLGAFAGAQTFGLAGPAVSAGVALTLTPSRLVLDAFVAEHFTRTLRVSPSIDNSIDSQELGLRACYVWGGVLRVGPCAALSTLRTSATASGFFAARSSDFFWLSAGLGGRVSLAVVNWLDVWGFAGLFVPVTTRPRFVIEGAGGAGTAAAVGAHMQLGLSLGLP